MFFDVISIMIAHTNCSFILLNFLLSIFFTLFRAFFGSLYKCLARGARAVLQLYAENMDQSEMIMTYAMRAGFSGGVVVDWPHRYGII